MGKIKDYLSLIRIKHYVKNLLIFFPLFFGGLYKNIENVYVCILGFFLFCAICSIVYIINDIKDIENDRLHEIKKNRPLAANKISIKEAIGIIILLVLISIFIGGLLIHLNISWYVLSLPLFYVLINFLYSVFLKNVVLVDVIVIVAGFLIRLFFGATLIDCEVSNWLYLTVMAGSFYLGFGKRRNEMIKSNHTRNVLSSYNKDFLDKNMYVCLTLTIVFYSMWTVDPMVLAKTNFSGLVWTVPLLTYILFQYSLIVENDSYGDPVDVILSSKILLFLILLYVVIMLLILL